MHDLAKLGPTSANTCPMRIVFVKSPEAKARLKPALMPANVDKTMAAPVTAIIAYDLKFHEFIPQLFPHNPKFAELFTAPGQEEFTRTHAFRNGTLQGAYFLLAARRMDLIPGRCRGLTMPRSTRSFFRTGAGSRTSWSTWATATRPSFFRGSLDWSLTRCARLSNSGGAWPWRMISRAQRSIDLDRYLARVGYAGALDATVETLRSLHFAHATSIPFENLDILLGRGISLELDALEAKLVTARRGGYCFEHKTLRGSNLAADMLEVT